MNHKAVDSCRKYNLRIDLEGGLPRVRYDVAEGYAGCCYLENGTVLHQLSRYHSGYLVERFYPSYLLINKTHLTIILVADDRQTRHSSNPNNLQPINIKSHSKTSDFTLEFTATIWICDSFTTYVTAILETPCIDLRKDMTSKYMITAEFEYWARDIFLR
ncbi:11130_t:CDS:2 [Ambispora leptoticha]|uniref:11130_t:CDS:1 n=1 Tax=Ambispora leptoticha TaxID=144679 RepID=A0A9N9AJB1_9GLOM|nr:11130_t:CDS:2 [Ambispora leptoticha]